MIKTTVCLFVLVTLATSSVIFAEASGSATGRYAIHVTSAERSELPGGGVVELSHYRQTIFAEDGEHPIDNSSADCVGMFRVSPAGALTAGSGACFTKTADGDGASFWWRMDAAGTESCPTLCGVWGYFDGYGKLADIRGNGWWKQTVAFSDGSIGTWGGSYSIE